MSPSSNAIVSVLPQYSGIFFVNTNSPFENNGITVVPDEATRLNLRELRACHVNGVSYEIMYRPQAITAQGQLIGLRPHAVFPTVGALSTVRMP